VFFSAMDHGKHSQSQSWDQNFQKMWVASSMVEIQNHRLSLQMSNYSAFQIVKRNSQSSHLRNLYNEEDVILFEKQHLVLFSQCSNFVDKVSEIVKIKEEDINQVYNRKRGSPPMWVAKERKQGRWLPRRKMFFEIK
jgi:hypothetical protein